MKAAQTTSLSKVESSIKQQLEQQRKNDAMTKWVETKKKSYCKAGIKYQVGYSPTRIRARRSPARRPRRHSK